MKRYVNIILVLVLIIFAGPSTRAAAFRAVQVFTLSSPDIAGLQGEFKQIKAAGFNTIIIRVFKNPYDSRFRFLRESAETGVYFESNSEPLVADVLDPVVREAHRQNLQVYAWITTRKSQWLLREHPEWDSPAMDPDKGVFKPGGHLDIYRNDVENRLTEMIVSLGATGVDGILLQDDFVSRQFEDLRSNAWRNFRGRSFRQSDIEELFDFDGRRVIYQPLFHQWARYKSKTLSAILSRMVRRVKTEFPEIQVYANLYYETVTAPQYGRQWLSQDIEDLSEVPVDGWAVMSYQRQMADELNLPVSSVAEMLKGAAQRLSSAYLLPESQIIWKFQAHDWKTGKLIDENEWFTLLKTFHPDRMVLVPYRGVSSLGPYCRAMVRIDSLGEPSH